MKYYFSFSCSYYTEREFMEGKMEGKKDFSALLAEEEFQNGIIFFDSWDVGAKRAFIKRFAISQEEFVRARTIISGLSFKETEFSEEELNYLWERLRIESSGITLRPKTQSRNIISWYSKIAAILFIPLLMASVWFFDKTLKLESFKHKNYDRLTMLHNTVSAPFGGKTKAVLPDGSEVWLNAGSSIEYPLLSKPEYREVKLTGEGYFKVTKDPDKPMLVTTSGMQVKVYGTTFNISAYEDDPDIKTALVEGEISIIRLNEEGIAADAEIKMKPGEIVILNKEKNTLDISAVNNMEVFTGWINGKYVFRNTRFKDILKRLERLHNVEFVLEDEAFGDYNFNATFEDQNIDRIMEIFAVSLPINWRSVKAAQNSDHEFSTRKIIISRDKTKNLQ